MQSNNVLVVSVPDQKIFINTGVYITEYFLEELLAVDMGVKFYLRGPGLLLKEKMVSVEFAGRNTSLTCPLFLILNIVSHHPSMLRQNHRPSVSRVITRVK